MRPEDGSPGIVKPLDQSTSPVADVEVELPDQTRLDVADVVSSEDVATL